MQNNNDLELLTLGGTSNYGYSGTKLNKLGATEYTLCVIEIDVSGSTSSFVSDMEAALKEIVLSCQKSPRCDNLMVRVISYDNKIYEIHGFKLLSDINIDDYTGCLRSGGTTAMYDAAVNGLESIRHYAARLYNDADITSLNSAHYTITDGWDNASTYGALGVAQAHDNLIKDEIVESNVSLLIGVGMADAGTAKQLDSVKTDCKYDEFLPLADAQASTLAKLARYISHSISSQSKSLNSGQAAPLPPASLSF